MVGGLRDTRSSFSKPPAKPLLVHKKITTLSDRPALGRTSPRIGRKVAQRRCTFRRVSTTRPATGAALARAALAGNPSDGYGGAVLAVTLPRWRAYAEAASSPRLRVEPANDLVAATARRFARVLGSGGVHAAVRWRTSIPQRVGLASSSALVIAVLRALGELHGVGLEPGDLADLALAVETEDLGIVAGPQDRVAQAYEGLTFMDFAAAGNGPVGRYESLDTALLPPLLIAWRPATAAESGEVHRLLRDRHARGDAHVVETMTELATAARSARDAVVAGEFERFGRCVDRTFDLRRRLLTLDPQCVEMIDVARGCRAHANYTGSGGAIVAVCRDDQHLKKVADVLIAVGCQVTGA
jgi:glucuronokinase